MQAMSISIQKIFAFYKPSYVPKLCTLAFDLVCEERIVPNFNTARHQNLGMNTQSSPKPSPVNVQRSNENMKRLESNFFRLGDYDCIGFDLDYTLSLYNIHNVTKLEYDILASYLVQEKGYDEKYLMQPIGQYANFLLKGLMLDFHNGNSLQIRSDGYVLNACHGTHVMSDKEIKEYYGEDRKWNIAIAFCEDILGAWNGPLSYKTRTLLDYFDMPASLAFARIVDSLDVKNGKKLDEYNIWPDILDGLTFMYSREKFKANAGGYFPILKKEPANYLCKCSDQLISWLQTMKKDKKVFLITGSNVDYATFIATYTLGEGWQELFDIVVCYARKPGFFVGTRPFLALNGFSETNPITADDLEVGNIYSQGNWKDLHQFLSKISGKSNPKCVYIGDNVIQDILIPHKYVNCDTVAVVSEMTMEQQMSNCKSTKLNNCNYWGSYFKTDKHNQNSVTIWSDIIMNNCKLCVPSVSALSENSIDFIYPTFSFEDGVCKKMGFYPCLKTDF